MQDLDADWDRIWVLDNRIQQGQPLEVTDDVLDLLRRTAPTVAISPAETEAALARPETATALIQKIEARIREGSHRLSRALDRMYNLRNSGDRDGARQQMRDLLAVEVVPHYRDIAEGQLEDLEDSSE